MPLKGEIVDCCYDADIEEGGIAGIADTEIRSGQTGLPVVQVEDIGAKQITGDAQCGGAQDGETLVIIRIINAISAIKAGPVVQTWVINEVISNFPVLAGVDIHRVAVRTKPDVQMVPCAAQLVQGDLPVAGKDHGDIIANAFQFGWERSQNIGQATGFCEGSSLGGHHEDAGHENHSDYGRQQAGQPRR